MIEPPAINFFRRTRPTSEPKTATTRLARRDSAVVANTWTKKFVAKTKVYQKTATYNISPAKTWYQLWIAWSVSNLTFFFSANSKSEIPSASINRRRSSFTNSCPKKRLQLTNLFGCRVSTDAGSGPPFETAKSRWPWTVIKAIQLSCKSYTGIIFQNQNQRIGEIFDNVIFSREWPPVLCDQIGRFIGLWATF